MGDYRNSVKLQDLNNVLRNKRDGITGMATREQPVRTPSPLTNFGPNYQGVYIATTYYWGLRNGQWVRDGSSDTQIYGSDPASMLSLIFIKGKNKM